MNSPVFTILFALMGFVTLARLTNRYLKRRKAERKRLELRSRVRSEGT